MIKWFDLHKRLSGAANVAAQFVKFCCLCCFFVFFFSPQPTGVIKSRVLMRKGSAFIHNEKVKERLVLMETV